jgi:predicted branched-subunit amino acid permease
MRVSDSGRREKISFYMGACLVFWCTWQLCSLIGSFLGSLPEAGVVGFAVPISFLALLAPQLSGRPRVFAAVVAAVVAVVGADLPANLGMMLGTFAGIATGVAFGWRATGEESSA